MSCLLHGLLCVCELDAWLLQWQAWGDAYVHIFCQDSQTDPGGCRECAFWNQDSAGKLGRLMASTVDQLEKRSVDLYVSGMGHMMAGIWDQVAQDIGLLVVEGLLGER